MAISYANKVAGAAANGRAGMSSGGGASQQGSGGGAAPQGGAAVKRVAPALASAPAGPKPAAAANAPGVKETVSKLSARLANQQAPANERLLFGANVLIGYKVEVQVRNGSVYEGIFHTMHINDAEVNVVLKYAKLIRDPSLKPGSEKEELAEKPIKTLVIHSNDLAQIVAKDVRFTPEDLSSDDRTDFGFETDASISRGRGGGAAWGRELQAWVPDENDDSGLLSLEGDSGVGANSGWDQFAVNKEKFGVESTFDEHIYTTKIDRNNCGITEAEAERLAREIEGGNTHPTHGNLHMMEERGFIADDSGDMDEEDKYSAVVRPGERVYQHPSYQQQHHGYHGNSQSPHDRARPRYPNHPGQHQQIPAPPAPRAPAWGGMGSGVAAVAGRVTGAPPPPPPPMRNPAAAAALSGAAAAAPAAAAPPPVGAVPSPSQPIAVPSPSPSAPIDMPGAAHMPSSPGSTGPMDIDPMRREANKVRSQLMAETGALARSQQKDRSSPYGTPTFGKGLAGSPLIHDPATLRALHLMPGKTQVDPEVQKDFQKWKQQQQQGAQDKKPQGMIDDLKNFSLSLAARQAGDKPDASSAAAASRTTVSSGGGAAPSNAAAPAAAAPAAEGPEKAAAAAAPAAEAPKKTSALNPNAKAFTLNFNAKPFVPPAAPAAAAAAAPAAVAAPAATPATPAATPAAQPAAEAAPAAASAPAVHSAPVISAGPPTSTGVHVPAAALAAAGLTGHPALSNPHLSHSSQHGPHSSSSAGNIHHQPGSHSRVGGAGLGGMHTRPEREREREPRGPRDDRVGMERRGGQGGSMGMDRGGMGMGSDSHHMGHVSNLHGMHGTGPMQQGQGSHSKMMGGMQGGGSHHGQGSDGPHHGMDHMGVHGKGGPHSHMPHTNPDHMGHKGAPPPPHHVSHQMEGAPGAMQPGMPPHAVMHSGAMPGAMGPAVYMQMGAPYHMAPNGMVGPGGMPQPGQVVYQAHGMRPAVGPNGQPVTMVPVMAPGPYAYAPMHMPAGGNPGGRPPFGYQGMPMGAMPIMAGTPMGPMPPMDHGPQRMNSSGNAGAGGSGGPASGGGKGNRGLRPDRRDQGGFHGGADRHHHASQQQHQGHHLQQHLPLPTAQPLGPHQGEQHQGQE